MHGYLELLAWAERLPHHPPEKQSLGLNFASAGFKEIGKPAGKPIRDAAIKLGFNLEDHRSEVVCPEHITNADLIIHMGPGNEKRLRQELTDHGMDVAKTMSKTHCLGEWCTPVRRNIQDFAFIKPRTAQFDEVVRYVVEACDKLFAEVIVPRAMEEQAK